GNARIRRVLEVDTAVARSRALAGCRPDRDFVAVVGQLQLELVAVGVQGQVKFAGDLGVLGRGPRRAVGLDLEAALRLDPRLLLGDLQNLGRFVLAGRGPDAAGGRFEFDVAVGARLLVLAGRDYVLVAGQGDEVVGLLRG